MRRRFSDSVGNTLSLPHAAGRTECDGHVELLLRADRAGVCNHATIGPPAVMQLFSPGERR
jgi:hypothetical protein